MSKSKKRMPPKRVTEARPWLSLRAGLVLMSITSVGLALFITAQTWRAQTPPQAILSGIIYGGLIWVIFGGMLLFNRWTGRGKN